MATFPEDRQPVDDPEDAWDVLFYRLKALYLEALKELRDKTDELTELKRDKDLHDLNRRIP